MTKKKKGKNKKSINEASEIASAQLQSGKIKNYSEATSIHIGSLNGGKRSLKTISEYKLNPNKLEANLNQQAGFSGEIKETARVNADRAFKGDKRRSARTDDLGSVNDPYIDIQEVGRNGKGIGKGIQLKFVGKNGADLAGKILSKKYEKYLDHDIPIGVPEDFYADTKDALKSRLKKLDKKIQSEGDTPQLQEQRNKLRKANRLLRKSKVTKAGACFAREHPVASVACDVGNVLHRAGCEGAKTGAKIGAGIAVLSHAVQILNGTEKVEDALVAIGETTVVAGATGYVATAGSTALATAMKKSGYKLVETLSKSNLPSAIVQTIVQSLDALQNFFSGKITGEECLKKLGQEGATVLGSSAGGLIGQALIPLPIVGALIGSIVGAAAAGLASGVLLQGFKKAEMAEREAEIVHRECLQYIAYMRHERERVRKIVGEYLSTCEAVFESAFAEIEEGKTKMDVDLYFSGAKKFVCVTGGGIEFESKDEFFARMNQDEPLRL